MTSGDYDELVELLHQVYGALHSGSLGTGRRSPEGLGRLDTGVLGYLSRMGSSTLTEAAQKLCVSKPQMSVLADRLVEQGLVERTRDEEDRRVTWIAITPAGRAALRAAVRSYSARMKELLAPLSQEQVMGIKSSLERLAAVLEGGSE